MRKLTYALLAAVLMPALAGSARAQTRDLPEAALPLHARVEAGRSVRGARRGAGRRAFLSAFGKVRNSAGV